jgi:hypothetical protein
MNLDGLVDQGDVDLATQLLTDARIASPALFHQESLPCRFERMIVASYQVAVPGEDLPVWIIKPGETASSTSLSVEQGTASVRAEEDDRSFLLSIDASQPAGLEVFLLRIAFSDATFFYSLPVP